MLGADDDAGAGLRCARRSERHHRAGRGRVLDVAVQAVRQPEQLREPVERQLLELLERRRGAPEDADLVQARAEQLGEDAGLRAGVREVGEEARALPVGERGQEDLVEVAEHVRERLGGLGRRRRQARAQLTRLDLREHRELAHALEVGRDPVDCGDAVLAEAHLRSFSIAFQGRVFRI